MPTQVALELEFPHDGSSATVTVAVDEEWAPHGAKRFLDLVDAGYFTDIRIYRVVPNFIAQWGIHNSVEEYNRWYAQKLPDDPVRQSNTRGRLTFATSGPNSRSCQIFVNFADNNSLDSQGFAPFGEVLTGMEHVDKIYGGYGESRGSGPDQSQFKVRGEDYIRQFEKLTRIKSATRQ